MEDADCCYTDIYCASRSLYGLAKDGQAFQIFSKARENGNPVFAVILSSMFAGLAYMNASKSAAQVFQYLVSLVTIFAVLNWVAILVSYICFKRALRAQGIPPSSQPYIGWLQPYGAYFALAMSLLVVVFQGEARVDFLLRLMVTNDLEQATMHSFRISRLRLSCSSTSASPFSFSISFGGRSSRARN